MLFTSVVIFAFLFSTSLAKDTYKAAVLEHYPIKDTHSYEDLVNTAKLYRNYIEVAAREQADIIVFPEDGLTASVNSEDSLWDSSTAVPNPEQKISPCDDSTGIYSEFLVEFSCASKIHSIYSVINLVEAVENRTGGRPILYNSNVVFDRNGTVIARHRKINLYEEYYYKPGPHTITTFTTDFGVTFGTFICFDIFFQSPADDVLKKTNVTDIAFPTSWYQELPFFIGNSVQHAYAVLNGVNFLASGMSDLDLGMGGSGIYSANGEVLAAFISGRNDSKLLIADVPKVKTRRESSNSCHKGGGNPKSSFAPHINLRETVPARLKNHTLYSIDLNETYIYRTICGSTKFCCTFNAAFRRTSEEVPNYSYKLLVYDGVTELDEKTMGFRQCALIACANNSVESCGTRNEKPPTGIHFEDLSITGSFENVESRYMPLTVTYDLLPANHYVFCKKNDSSKVLDVSMYTTRAMDDLITFGILGRAFQNDNKPPGRMTDVNSSNKTKVYTLRVVLILAMYYETYKAAVLEYHPVNSDNAYEDFFTNVRMFLKYIEEAALQGVDIIVFPEDGLTGWMFDDKYIPTFATEIPDSDSGVSPCIDRNGSYANYLINLSCACKRNKIYSVVNIIEVVHDSNGDKIYHNTNIALNRAGVVIAKYRKINLYDELFYKPGQHVVSTFTTDFGVTFGMFICFDVVFQSPGIDILQNTEVTDIAYSTAWFARLPFYAANSVQHGYAKLHGLNFLAAGLNDPKTGLGGSGIYLADGGILSVHITGNEESKLIIANVPKIKSRLDLSNSCQHAGADSVNSHSSDVHRFFTNTTDFSNYTVQSLDLNNLEISETVCAKSSEFCCTFNATMKKYSPLPNYSYKLIAYSGVSAVSTTKNIGLKQCALVACSEDNIASCGQRNKGFPSGIYFEYISVSGTFDTNDAIYMPSTVTYDLLPTNRYVYCRTVSGKQEEVSMYTTQKLDSLLTFGILGRTFKYDDNTPGIITDAASDGGHIISYMAFVLILLCCNCLWII